MSIPAGKLARAAARLVVGVVTLVGCRAADPSLFPPKPGERSADLIVVDNHWHTSLVFRADDLPPVLQPQRIGLGPHRYVMVGWGDAGFFRAEKVTPAMVAEALFYSRGSVLLAVGFDGLPEATFMPGVDVFRVPVSRPSLANVVDTVAGTFRLERGDAVDLGPGIDGGRFYAAHGRYAFYHTCNQWTADALAAGGLPISPVFSATAGGVAFQLRQMPGVLRNGRLVPNPTPPDAAALRLARGGRP